MKNFIKKLIFTSAVLVSAAILIAFLFVLYFNSVEENNYIVNSSVTFNNTYDYFKTRTSSAKTVLDDLTIIQLKQPEEGDEDEPSITDDMIDYSPHIEDVLYINPGEDFLGLGYVTIPSSGDMADVFYNDGENIKSLKISADVYTSFGDKYVIFTALNADGENFKNFFGKKTNKEVTGYDYLLLIAKDSSLKGFEGYTFSNFAVLNKHGIVVDSLHKDDGFKSTLSGDIDGKYTDIGSKQYLLFSKSLDTFNDYYFAGIINKAEITSHIVSMSIRVYVFIIIFCVIVLAIFVLFIYFMLKDKTRTGLGEYFLEVDVEGNIINIDKMLSQKYKKISGNIKDYLEDSLTGDSVVIKLEKDDGEYSYFNCKKIIKKTTKKILFMASDITDLYKDYIRIHLQHFTDDVTEMPNIMQMEMDFKELMESRNKSDLVFIVYELGIEKYSALYGFEFYKKLLKILAKRLAEIYTLNSSTYYLTSDRIMVMASKNINDIVAKIDSATEFIGTAVRVDDLIINAVVKAGFLIYSLKDAELSLSQIISRTEVALSYARSSAKKSNYGYVDSIMRSKQALSNEDIKEIVSAGEITVHFQPQYSMIKKRIVGFETLTRLSGKYSYISPATFIENVEQNGAMVMLGDYINDKAMQFASTLEDKSIKISVNVSPLQLLGDKFVERFIAGVSTYQLSPSQIGIEITETYEMSAMSKVKEMLKELQKEGIHVSIDDFGEKYSSLKYIKSLPINSIKIDKEFVDEIENDKSSRIIVETILNMGKNLGLYTIVEGVESQEQVDVLKGLGADIIQGHIIGKAVTEDVAKEYIVSKKNLFNQEGSKK